MYSIIQIKVDYKNKIRIIYKKRKTLNRHRFSDRHKVFTLVNIYVYYHKKEYLTGIPWLFVVPIILVNSAKIK
jgi:hypothetical protein